MSRFRIAALAVASSLGGCAVGPVYEAPSIPPHANGAFTMASAVVDPSVTPPDDWWRLYDDEALSHLVREALASNTDVRVAVAHLELARAVVREANAGRYPATGVSAGVSWGRSLIADSIAGVGHHVAENQTTTLGGVDVSYEVDLFGRVSRSIEAATADAEATEATRDAVRVAVAAETTRAYVAARSAARELAVAQRSWEIADAAVKIVTLQIDAGAASRFDLARIRVLADQALAQLPTFEGRRRAALFELAALLGRIPEDVPDVAALDPSNRGGPPLMRALPVGDGAQLLARRPDVRESERRLAAATARIGVATSALYPKISFGADVGYASNHVLGGSNAFQVAIGPLVSWSFPDQAVARARIAQSNAAASAALAAFDGAVLHALKEVEQAISACEAETSRRLALLQTEEDATEAYRLAEVRRREGVLSQLDLLTAEQGLLSARAALAAADTRVADAQISLFKALGGGWRNA